MRCFVSADTHLGSPIRSVAIRNPELGERLKQASFDTFRRIVDMAISEAVDALVLAGDIFDSDFPDLKSRMFLIAQLTRASAAGIPTFLIRGNHDALLDHTTHGNLGPGIHLLHKGNPTVEIGNVVFHGLSFEKNHLGKSLLSDYPEPVIGRTMSV
ncbi:MAG: metallophosphoesterase [Paracoccaceae bacterium]